jgi:sirohydrochlorin cobaltochelatase
MSPLAEREAYDLLEVQLNFHIPADAILLVGHGTRNELGQQQFLKLAEHLRAAVAPLPVEVAYIELQTPSIQDALISLHAQRLKKIILSPALLFAAGHAKQDVPAAVELAQQHCPGLVVTLAEPLGCHEAVLQLAAKRFQNSLAPVVSVLRAKTSGEGRGEGPAPQIDPGTALVLIGRGSSDLEAIADCRLFGRLLGNKVNAAAVFFGFIAIAQPSLAVALHDVAQSGIRRVVVQPHLLFAGEMLETTTAAMRQAQQLHPTITWIQAPALGSDLFEDDSLAAKYLVRALIDRLKR